MAIAPAFVMVSGDLTNDGADESYTLFKDFVIPGFNLGQMADRKLVVHLVVMEGDRAIR